MFANKKLIIAVLVILIILAADWYYRKDKSGKKSPEGFDSARENFESNQADMNSA